MKILSDDAIVSLWSSWDIPLSHKDELGIALPDTLVMAVLSRMAAKKIGLQDSALEPDSAGDVPPQTALFQRLLARVNPWADGQETPSVSLWEKALLGGNVPMIALLLEGLPKKEKAVLERSLVKGKTPLAHALVEDDKGMVSVLLAAGFSPNLGGDVHALEYTSETTLPLLLNAGATFPLDGSRSPFSLWSPVANPSKAGMFYALCKGILQQDAPVLKKVRKVITDPRTPSEFLLDLDLVRGTLGRLPVGRRGPAVLALLPAIHGLMRHRRSKTGLEALSTDRFWQNLILNVGDALPKDAPEAPAIGGCLHLLRHEYEEGVGIMRFPDAKRAPFAKAADIAPATFAGFLAFLATAHWNEVPDHTRMPLMDHLSKQWKLSSQEERLAALPLVHAMVGRLPGDFGNLALTAVFETVLGECTPQAPLPPESARITFAVLTALLARIRPLVMLTGACKTVFPNLIAQVDDWTDLMGEEVGVAFDHHGLKAEKVLAEERLLLCALPSAPSGPRPPRL